ncbi:hypothetical protein [Serratia plymuthica]|uniref:hypothetical protein n=1 Tax=Serratia plymuthica TaxID=82996 RepID=UPI0018D928B1|nr:hypothetical protein [Serratia plymuthica]QPS58139.1 hypothetical protein I6G53_11815 [Serratia plymuthica]CAI1919482.1 Uncharacterised protein [Serratia plymuthica]
MARPRKAIEVPGQETVQKNEAAENATDVLLLNSVAGGIEQQPANTPEQLNAATAGATVLNITEGSDSTAGQEAAPPVDLAARNAALTGLNVQGFAVISMFEALNYTDEHDHPLTNSLEFIALVKKATDVTAGGTGQMVTNEEGNKQPAPGKPVLTEHGWHVPG